MNTKNVLVTLIFISGICFTALAQNDENGSVVIIQNSKVDSLLKIHTKMNEYNMAHEEHDGLDGYRIQIYFESGNDSKNKTLTKRDRFIELYPDIPAYVIFMNPYYQLRVGDFRTKLEAEAFYKKIQRQFPGANVISGKIKLPVIDKIE